MRRQGACLQTIHSCQQIDTSQLHMVSESRTQSLSVDPNEVAEGEARDCVLPRGWRVDKDDVSSVFVRMRQSLLGEGLFLS